MRAGNQSVADRAGMGVLDVASEIPLVAYVVFPIATLPDGAFAAGHATWRFTSCVDSWYNVAREPALDGAPADGEIGIVGGQRPDAMQVVGQDDDGLDGERPNDAGPINCLTQSLQGIGRSQGRPPFVGHDREEERAAGHEGSPVFGHGDDGS